MTVVPVQASRSYQVQIGAGLLDEAGERLRALSDAAGAAVLSDDNVYPLYGKRLVRALEAAGFRVESFVVPHGERSKSLDCYGQVLDFLSRARMGRSDLLIALGGGVVGDLGGFAAATYQRGIGFVQMPTTLLAAVDSSVGGKTGIDLETGKNQVGCFYQPLTVLCDPTLLQTLPEEEWRCGSAEVIKYAMLQSDDFFRQLSITPIRDQLEEVIRRCVEMKRDIVARDEFDRGERQLLNLGHSIGHAIEQRSGYRILHGQAVAAGMAMITRSAVARGLCSRESLARLLELLELYGLPTETEYGARELLPAMLADKKLTGGRLCLVVPEAVGRCRLMETPVDDLEDWLRLGGAK